MIAAHPISLAQRADTVRIAQLSRYAIEYGLAWRWTPRRVLKSVEDASTNVVVARHGMQLSGFAIMKYADQDAHLLLLAVDAMQRRTGVGSALLAWLEATVRVAGIGLIHLETRTQNSVARTFYRHHGFKETSVLQGYYEGAEDAIRMTKDLTPGL